MEDVKPSYIVRELYDDSSNFSESIGITEKRFCEMAEIITEAHNNSDRMSEATELMTRYAQSPAELFFMGYMYHSAKTMNEEKQAFDKLKRALGSMFKDDEDDSND